MVTLAWGKTLPDESLTVPETLPATLACAAVVHKNKAIQARWKGNWILIPGSFTAAIPLYSNDSAGRKSGGNPERRIRIFLVLIQYTTI
jgi:hypothetical protein